MLDYDEHRRHMVTETSAFITWGLANPAKVRWIPHKRVGEGGFSRRFQTVFWTNVFGAAQIASGDLVHRFLRWARLG